MKAILFLTAVLSLTGCVMDTPAKSGEAATSLITLSGSAFHPGTAHGTVNTLMTFRNDDGFSHGVTRDSVPSGASNTPSANFGHNGTYTYTPAAAGTYEYHCTIHGVSMAGTLIIVAP